MQKLKVGQVVRYKLRAECSHDVLQFLKNAIPWLSWFAMTANKCTPDVEFEFETNMTYSNILSIIESIDDAHVMYQTVNPVELYTGERIC